MEMFKIKVIGMTRRCYVYGYEVTWGRDNQKLQDLGLERWLLN